ncbi:MAG: class I SAM-dependent methyltransferase [Acidimicrobiia bacterium]
MSKPATNHYYAKKDWDVDSWVDVITVEYETLIRAFPFDQAFRSLPASESRRLLDVGCGTAIFPGYLDVILSPDVHLRADLWDISESSLEQARDVLNQLPHFSVGRAYQALIEDLPSMLSPEAHRYEVIWAIHSFTTVNVERMGAVYARLLQVLRPGGYLFVYQLTAESSYQRFHGLYRAEHPHGRNRAPYMKFEDSQKILDSLGAEYEVYPQRFAHEIAEDHADLLEKYLRKVILDDTVDVRHFFGPLLETFYDPGRGRYVIPQSVNLITVHK